MRTFWWPIIIIVSAIGAGVAAFLDIGAPIQTVIGFWFLLICPGMAYVRLLEIKEFFTELVLAVTLSIAINTIVSQVLVFANLWSPMAGLLVLIDISSVGCILQVTIHYVRPADTDQ